MIAGTGCHAVVASVVDLCSKVTGAVADRGVPARVVVEAEPAEHREPCGAFGRPASRPGRISRFGEAKNDLAAALSAEVPTAPMDRWIPARWQASAGALAPY